MVERMRDRDVRAAALRRLLAHAQKQPDTLIVHELGLSHGAARVDIAVINGHIRGFEIKADADNLERLPRQIEAYGQVVDRATLIVAERHLAGAKKMVPAWWGVISVGRALNGGLVFRRIRDEYLNRATDPVRVAQLMWSNEAREALRAMGAAPALLRAPRAALYAALAKRVPKTHLAALVRHTLKTRSNWRDHQPPL